MIYFVYASGIWQGGGLSYLCEIIDLFDKPNTYIFLDSFCILHTTFILRFNLCLFNFSWSLLTSLIRFKLLFYILRYFKRSTRPCISETFSTVYLLLFICPLRTPKFHIISKFTIFRFSTDHLLSRRFLLKSIIAFTPRLFFLPTHLLVQSQFMLDLLSNSKLTYNSARVLKSPSNTPILSSEDNNIFDISPFNSKETLYFYPSSSLGHKNHLTLFQAFRLLQYALPDHFRLIVTVKSSDFPDFQHCSPNITFLGDIPRSEVFAYYGLSDFLIFPSLTESFGMPLYEATTLNLPILASDRPFVFNTCTPLAVFNQPPFP